MKHYSPKNSTKNLFYLFKLKIYFILSFILIYKNSHSFETHEIADGYYVHFGKQEDSNKENKGDILIFPSLEAGNIAYKLTERLGYYKAVGPIFQGLKK